jgi:uncharacterized 2Fe-2S/4Fe-4S cluster protein (DUF4445 family)
MAIHVDFEPVGRRGECSPGQSLLDCARQLGVELVNFCGGTGSCGRCTVQVLDGRVSEPAPGETGHLSPEELAEGYRLACRTIPLGDCKVRVPPESLTSPQRTQIEGIQIPVVPEPLVETYLVTLHAPSLDDPRADAGQLLEAMAQQHGVLAAKVDLTALRNLSPRLRGEGWQVCVAAREGEVIGVLSSTSRPLGLAVDLGTTKIAVYLVDLETGRTLAAEGLMNPQIAYGEDVVARMAFANQGSTQTALLQTLVIEALNEIVARLCSEIDAEPSEILDTVVVGNTAMHHLFLQLPVKQLAAAPYVSAIGLALDVKARDLRLRVAPGAYVHLLPNVAGYVGADHVAMLLATEIAQASGAVLALDIGTNTEVCLANRGVLTSLSCASGPAFEGAHIKHGMRAANGAIEHLRIVDDRIEYQTIGGVPAVGLCGSGILDTLAHLCQAGVVDARGRMGEHPRVQTTAALREFVLIAEAERLEGQPAITLTQDDVQELQLAKGAVRTGIDVLLEIAFLVADDLDRVIIGGAFGTYIDIASAIAVGMLPRLPLDRFQQVGNVAGMGAKLALLSRRKRAEAQAIARRVGYIELAAFPKFARRFAQAMYFR